MKKGKNLDFLEMPMLINYLMLTENGSKFYQLYMKTEFLQ